MSRFPVALALLAGGLHAALTTLRFKGLYQRSLTIDESAIETVEMGAQNRRLLRRFAADPRQARRSIALSTGVSVLALTAGLLLLVL